MRAIPITVSGVLTSGLVLVGLVVIARPGVAGDGVHCEGTFEFTQSPGVGLQQGTGTYRTVDPGTTNCTGSVDGHKPSGAGRWTWSGTYTGNCTGASGEGTVTTVVPTDAGQTTFTRSYKFELPTLPSHGGLVGGRFNGPNISGTYDFTPTRGDCVTTPITAGTAIAAFDAS